MALLICNAILHTIGSNEGAPLLSNVELDTDSETCTEFVGKHVRRLLGNPGAREATFTAESAVYALVKSYQKGDVSFRELSQRVCERLAGIMKDNEDIPPADVLVVSFTQSGKQYLAILKLNYGECYTHRLTSTEGGIENQIVKNTAVLPLNAGKVEEACLIPYDPMVLRIMEKPHAVGGEQVAYFSKLFLECTCELSKKETAGLILETAQEVSEKHFSGNPEVEAKIKCALIEEAAEDEEADGLTLENVALRVFPENEAVREEFVSLAREQGLPHEVKLDRPFAQREFKMQRFKADNGVEIKCPAELFSDPDAVLLETNGDGSITITFKNLRRCESERAGGDAPW